jgi:hypothetical protein
MLINGGQLNSAPLNGSSSLVGVREPEYVLRGIGARWRLRVTVGGVDMSDQVLNTTDSDREEGASGVGSLDLFIESGPVVPDEWQGLPVTFDFISTSAGVTVEERRYTARIALPTWDSTLRVLSCDLSDQIQQQVEAQSVAVIDALTGGTWSEDVFEPVQGRSRWDYALERLSTRTASLDCSAAGVLRVTDWYADAVPHFVFGPGTTIDQSVTVDMADTTKITNRVEIEVSYRYARLWQRNQVYSWIHPETDGSGGIGGFCNWRGFSSELPTIQMLEDAARENDQTLIATSYYLLPPTMPNPCGDGIPWTNIFTDLLLGADWTAARRWTQSVTENYTIVLATPAGEVEASRIVGRSGTSLEIEDLAADAWESEPITDGTTGTTDLNDEARRSNFLTISMLIAQAELVSAHRQTTVSWQIPTPLARGIDLTHTLELDDQGVKARGKCIRIVDNYDHAGGSALTTLSIAVMRGGGTSDPLVPPAALGAADVSPGQADATALPTQISYFGGPDYDPDLDGFSGNISVGGGPSVFPRDFVTPAEELPEAWRDERVIDGEYLYRVGIPNDLLEL